MSVAIGESASPPRERVILLGASNAARGIATAIQTARAACGGPFDFLTAMGHGRSYGMATWFLGRRFPSILDCQLWTDLKSRDTLPTRAVLTDVGNDILFGASVKKISDWVGEAIERLHEHQCRIVLTGIPLGSLALMSRWEFPLFRSLFFPTCRLSFDEAMRRASELDEHLQTLAAATNCAFVEPPADWYARDRIHVARRLQPIAWRQFFTPISDGEFPNALLATTGEFFRVRSLTPYYRTLFGVPNRREQPSATLRDGTIVSLY